MVAEQEQEHGKGKTSQPSSGQVKRPLLCSKRKSSSRVKVSGLASPSAPSPQSSLGVGGRKVVTFRLILLGILLAVVATVVEVLLRSGLVGEDSSAGDVLVQGDAVESLGAEARPPAGLREVSPCHLAYLEDLPKSTVDCVQRQLDTSQRRGLPIEVENSIGMRFRLVPAGEYVMGSPEGEVGHSVVERQHPVTILEPFYLGKFEVTQAQWEAVMGSGSNPSHFRGGTLPVEEVSWLDCLEFVRRLNELEGLPKHSYRLPSEEEWEYACRGGSQTAYCYGDDVRRLEAWCDYANNARGTAPVGQKRANALGLYDMHGSVWEWCRDYYRNYPGDPTPRSDAHRYRCIRGGNWYVSPVECRSANRSRLPDRSKGNMLGFRVMRIIEPER